MVTLSLFADIIWMVNLKGLDKSVSVLTDPQNLKRKLKTTSEDIEQNILQAYLANKINTSEITDGESKFGRIL